MKYFFTETAFEIDGAPGIFLYPDDGGDPVCLGTFSRVHHPERLHALCGAPEFRLTEIERLAQVLAYQRRIDLGDDERFGDDGMTRESYWRALTDAERDLMRLRAAAALTALESLSPGMPETRAESDNDGWHIIDALSSNINESWHDEFRDWYDPAQWLGVHRAVAAFVEMKWRAAFGASNADKAHIAMPAYAMGYREGVEDAVKIARARAKLESEAEDKAWSKDSEMEASECLAALTAAEDIATDILSLIQPAKEEA